MALCCATAQRTTGFPSGNGGERGGSGREPAAAGRGQQCRSWRARIAFSGEGIPQLQQQQQRGPAGSRSRKARNSPLNTQRGRAPNIPLYMQSVFCKSDTQQQADKRSTALARQHHFTQSAAQGVAPLQRTRVSIQKTVRAVQAAPVASRNNAQCLWRIGGRCSPHITVTSVNRCREVICRAARTGKAV